MRKPGRGRQGGWKTPRRSHRRAGPHKSAVMMHELPTPKSRGMWIPGGTLGPVFPRSGSTTRLFFQRLGDLAFRGSHEALWGWDPDVFFFNSWELLPLILDVTWAVPQNNKSLTKILYMAPDCSPAPALSPPPWNYCCPIFSFSVSSCAARLSSITFYCCSWLASSHSLSLRLLVEEGTRSTSLVGLKKSKSKQGEFYSLRLPQYNCYKN